MVTESIDDKIYGRILGYRDGIAEEITLTQGFEPRGGNPTYILPTNSDEPLILEFCRSFEFEIGCCAPVCDNKAAFVCVCNDEIQPYCPEHMDIHAYHNIEIAPEKPPQELKGFNRKDRTKDGKKKFYY